MNDDTQNNLNVLGFFCLFLFEGKGGWLVVVFFKPKANSLDHFSVGLNWNVFPIPRTTK